MIRFCSILSQVSQLSPRTESQQAGKEIKANGRPECLLPGTNSWTCLSALSAEPISLAILPEV
jgi:hypothetical protein